MTKARKLIVIVTRVVDAKPANQTELILDGAAGDPACKDALQLQPARVSYLTHIFSIALAFAVLLINSRIDNETWATAADQEIEYLYNEVPETEDGGISHRHEQVQLWADFVYMVSTATFQQHKRDRDVQYRFPRISHTTVRSLMSATAPTIYEARTISALFTARFSTTPMRAYGNIFF